MIRLASGIVPIRYQGKKPIFLLLRCYNYWDFPKGEIEPGENPWEAAIRELGEETGITNIKALSDKAYIETEVYSKNKIARYYLAEVETEMVVLRPNPVTGIIEHHEYRWVSYEQARQLLVPRLQKVLEWSISEQHNNKS